MKKRLLISFLLFFNFFMVSAGTNPPGGTIFYISPICQLTQAVPVVTNELTLGGIFSSSVGLSINAVTGEIQPNVSQPGTYVVTYDVPADLSQQEPAYSTTAVVVIVPLYIPQFPVLAPICQGTTAPILPSTSLDGTTGIWSPSVIDNQNSGIYTFTPDAGQCATSVSLSITVIGVTVPVFGASSTTICAGSTPPIFPTTSLNGITGTWSPSTVDTTIGGIYTFTPDPGQCAVPTTTTVLVMPLPTATISGSGTVFEGSSAFITFVGTPNATVIYQYNGGSFQAISLDSLGIATFTIPPNAGQTTVCLVSVISNGILNCTMPLSGCATVLANSQFDFNDLTYSPNPVADVLNIKSSELFKSIKIHNNLGQEVYQQKATTFDLKLDLGFLKTGNYFITLESDEKHQVIQVIKK